MVTAGNPTLATELISVLVRGQEYCLDAASIREILGADRFRLNEISDTPFGWIPVAGETIPVHAVSWLVQGVFVGDPRRSKVIVLEHEGVLWGVLVDSFDALPDDAEVFFHPLPDAARGRRAGLFRGLARIDGEHRLYLAAERLRPGGCGDLARQDGHPSRPRGAAEPSPLFRGSVIVCYQTLGAHGDLSLELALSIDELCESVPRPTSLVRVHEAPDHLCGIADWRGAPIPVVDWARLLGIDSPASRELDELVVARIGASEEWVALSANRRPRPVRLAETPGPSPNGFDARFVRGAVVAEGRLVLIPDLRAMREPLVRAAVSL